MARKKSPPSDPIQLQPEVRTAIYLRVSTDEQAAGYGLDVQRERCCAQAVVKGWTVVREYEDAGISGTKGEQDRPGLAALLADVERGEIHAVIVLALDRLGRKTSMVLDLVERLSSAGAAFVSCKEVLDTATPQGKFVLTMFAALAQLERDTIVQRTTDGRNQRGKQDGEKGGRLPMGYIRTAEGVEIDPERAELVRRIFTMRRTGMTLTTIANVLDAEGYTTPRGGRWTASSLHYVLKNEADYSGGRRGESNISWPPILR
jgi:site-specific DNA recombinase